MSVSKNLYEILGNVEEDSNKVIVTKELTKNSGSSKKSAAPRDPGAALGASKKSNQPLRDQNRSKSTEPQAEKKGKPARNPRPDRRSQTGKSDSAKKVGKGWGDSKGKLADEKAGDAIATKDESAPTEPETPVEEPVAEPDNTKTLEQYLAEQKAGLAKLASGRSVRQANAGAESKYAESNVFDKEEATDFVSGTKAKNVRTRARKEKVLLEIEPAFPVNRGDRPERSERSERGPRENRGGRDGKRGGDKKGGFRAQERKTPSVNLSSASDFPALGA